MKNLILFLSLSTLLVSSTYGQSFESIWELTDLGDNIGEPGLILLDVDNNGSQEIIFGSSQAIFVAGIDQNNEYQFISKGINSTIKDIVFLLVIVKMWKLATSMGMGPWKL